MTGVHARGRAAGMVGRDAEVAVGREALRRVAPASGHALLITGEAGIGKTRLVEMLVDEASDRFIVAAETASELESELPLAPLVRALRLRPDASDRDAAALGALLADAHRDPEVLRLQMIEGIADLIERWSLDRPVLLVVEDLHWADDATLQALDQLARRLQHVGVLVVGTARPHPRPELLAALERTLAQVDATTLELSPLQDDETLYLARQVLSAEPGPHLLSALGRAGGNPLYVTELLEIAGDRLDLQEGVVDLLVPGVPGSVHPAILRNLASLPDATLDALRVAAVLGTRFELRELALAVDQPEPAVIEALAPALAAEVVAEVDDRLGFRHDLVRDAVYEDQPAAVRAAWHRRVVERLRAAGVPDAGLAPHLLRGDWHGVPEALGWLAEAGRAMRHRSVPLAVDLLTRALELRGEDVDPDLRLDLAETLAADDRTTAAEDVLQPLLAAPPSSLTQDVRDRLAATWLGRLAMATAEDIRRHLDALETAGLGAPGRRWADVTRAWLRFGAGDLEAAEALAVQVQEAAAEAGDHFAAFTISGLLTQIADGRMSSRMPEHARTMLAHARAIPHRPELQFIAAAELAVKLGSHPDAREEIDHLVFDALALATRTGLQRHEAGLDAVIGVNAQRRGDWDEAAMRFDAVIAYWQETSEPASAITTPIARAARLNVHRDELAVAEERITWARTLRDRDRATGYQGNEIDVFVADAEVRLATGDASGAVETLEALAGHIEERGIGFFLVSRLPYVIAIADQAGRPDTATAAVERAEAWMRTHEQPDRTLTGLVGWGRAHVDGDADILDELVAWADEPQRPLWEWRPRIRESAAAALAAIGEQDRAVERLQEAYDLWEQAGAVRDVARVRQTLRDLGVHRGRGRAADRPTTGWDSLTDAEWRVVELVGEGLIYREIGERLFVSRRTVETHVASVFRKLGVSSRRDLSRRLHAEAPGAPTA